MPIPAAGLRVPPLPDSWPYRRREGHCVWAQRSGIDLGLLGKGWILTLPEDLDLSAPAGDLAGAYGRGGIHRRGEVVVRPYRRGGLLRHLLRTAYASPRRFAREWLIHLALWEAGFPTLEPLGFGYRRRGPVFEGVYLTRYCEGAPWPSDWSTGTARSGDLRTAVEALDRWGLWAPDLNATNVLIVDGGLRLLDWDRAAFVPAGGLLRLYRRRLQRSLERLGAPPSARLALDAALGPLSAGG